MLWSITYSQIEEKMNKLIQNFAYKFPNLRHVLILLKLYCKHPQKLVLDLKVFKQIYIEFHHHAIKHYSSKDTNMLVSSICKKGFKSFSLDDNNYLFYKNCVNNK